MIKNEFKKSYDITIIGGGLAGKLIVAMLRNCNLFDENKLCWINTDNKNFKDLRVSFINYNNFLKLKKSILLDISSKDYSVIDKIELHNSNEKYPLKLNDFNKIPSAMITNLDFIEQVAKKRKKTFTSIYHFDCKA